MAEFHIGRIRERGRNLGYDHHEPVCGPLTEHWAGSNEEVGQECEREEH